MDGDGAEGGDGDGEEAAAFTALALRSWTRKSPAVRTFIRPGAAGKLQPPPQRLARDPEAEAGAEAPEAAAAAEAEGGGRRPRWSTTTTATRRII